MSCSVDVTAVVSTIPKTLVQPEGFTPLHAPHFVDVEAKTMGLSPSAWDATLTAVNDAGLMARPAWNLMHYLEPYANCPRMPLPVAEDLIQPPAARN